MESNSCTGGFMMPECKSAKISGAAWRCRMISVSHLAVRPKKQNFKGKKSILEVRKGSGMSQLGGMLPAETTRSPAKFGEGTEGIHGVKVPQVQQSQQQLELRAGLTHSSQRPSVPPARRCEPPLLTWRWRRKLCYLHQHREGREHSDSCPKTTPEHNPSPEQGGSPWDHSLALIQTHWPCPIQEMCPQRKKNLISTHFEKAPFLLFSLLIISRVLFL